MSVLKGLMTHESLKKFGFEVGDNGDMVNDEEMYTIPSQFIGEYIPVIFVDESEYEFEDFDYVLEDDTTFIKSEWCEDYKRF